MSAETRGVTVAAVVVHEISHAGQQWTGAAATISLSRATRQSQFTKLLIRPNVPYTFVLNRLTVLVLWCVTVKAVINDNSGRVFQRLNSYCKCINVAPFIEENKWFC